LGQFSIKDIESITGIKGHTLRIWEQRFGILNPKRTETNIRYYDDDDLKKSLNISLLCNNNYKISEISKMSSEEINEAVLKITASNTGQYLIQIKKLLTSMMFFDEKAFHQDLNIFIDQYGFNHTYNHIILPLLTEVGILWQTGSVAPAHEHFVTNLIKGKIFSLIDSLIGTANENPKKFLLFLPENEKHSLALLFANYNIRAFGHEVTYLGQEMPLESIKKSFGQIQPDYIYTISIIANPKFTADELLDFLTENWPNSSVLVSGCQFFNSKLENKPNVKLLTQANEFVELLESI
jgi:DNA-binding transcriptional MerR regulator